MRLNDLKNNRIYNQQKIDTVNRWLKEEFNFEYQKPDLRSLVEAKGALDQTKGALGNKMNAHKNPQYVKRLMMENAVDLMLDEEIAKEGEKARVIDDSIKEFNETSTNESESETKGEQMEMETTGDPMTDYFNKKYNKSGIAENTSETGQINEFAGDAEWTIAKNNIVGATTAMADELTTMATKIGDITNKKLLSLTGEIKLNYSKDHADAFERAIDGLLKPLVDNIKDVKRKIDDWSDCLRTPNGAIPGDESMPTDMMGGADPAMGAGVSPVPGGPGAGMGAMGAGGGGMPPVGGDELAGDENSPTGRVERPIQAPAA